MNQLKLFIIVLFVAFANISFSNAQWTTSGTNVYNISGNVGIGSSNLYDKLTICGTSSWTGQSIKSNSSSGGAYIDFYNSNEKKFGGCTMDETANAMILRTYCCDGQIKLQTNWADRLIIDKDGKVGIGVTPVAKLDIKGNDLTSYINFASIGAGNIKMGTTGGIGEYGALWINQSAPSTLNYAILAGTGMTILNSQAGDYMYFTEANVAKMTMKKGMLGIGTITPNAKLESVSGVNAYPATSGTSQTGAALRLRGGDNAILDFGMNSTNTWIQATDQLNLSLKYNLCLNPNGGNIGIATPSPTAKLDIAAVNGEGIRIGKIGDQGNLSVALGALSAQYNIDFTGYRDISNDQIGARISALRFNCYNANNALVQNTGLAFYTNPIGMNTGTTDLAERMRILPNGFIGIGTSNPQNMLDVKGTIRATEVLVQDISQFVPDFVFEKDYSLPTLNYVSDFIKVNKHLPNIESAKQVKENGMSLVDMQLKLLQKVEELTLYVIDQNKKIEELEKKVK